MTFTRVSRLVCALTGAATMLVGMVTPVHAFASQPRLTESSLLATAPAGVGDLYAINELTHHVVRFDLVGGRWQTSLVGTGWVDPVSLAVTANGSVWVVDGGRRRLDLVPAGSYQRGIVDISSSASAALVTDPRGNAFVTSGTKLIKVSASGSYVTQVAGAPPSDQLGDTAGLGVDSAGRPTTVYLGPDRSSDQATSNLQLATYPALGGTPTIRKINDYAADPQAVSDVREAGNGALVMHVQSTGGSGVVGLDRIDAGSSTVTYPTELLSTNAAAFDASGRLYVVKGRTYCTIPAEGDGCRPDESVDQIHIFSATAGTATSVPISGLEVPRGGLAVNAAGTVYASRGTDAPDRPLSVVRPGGGAAQQIIVGEFTQLVVPPGK